MEMPVLIAGARKILPLVGLLHPAGIPRDARENSSGYRAPT
jgi:hypothetical protein